MKLSQLPADTPASAPVHGLTHSPDGAAPDKRRATPPGLTSSRASRGVGASVYLAYAFLLLAIALAVLILGMAMSQPAKAQETTPTVSTYQEAYKDWAWKWTKIAKRERAKLVKLTNAFRMDKPRPLPFPAQFTALQIDVTSGTEVVVIQWKDYGQKAKDTARWYTARRAQLWQRMTKPGGAGVQRWAPLLRYCGLPEAWMWRSLTIMRGESNGNPLCVYCGHYGLFQFTSAWWAGRWDWRSPYHQCRVFVKAVKAGGWHHWAATDPYR